MRPPVPKSFKKVFAYGRISSEGQVDGNGISRQREALHSEVFRRVRDMDVKYEELVWLEDLGLSAYHGHHMARGVLGEFLAQVKAGQIPPDSLFICESVSRASRQGAFVLLGMVNTMLDANMCVLLLQQGKLFNKDHVPKFLSVELSLYAELAREESLIKADFARDNWKRLRERARENPGEFVFTRECPRWLSVVNGRYEVKEEKAAAVREIYALALDGYGVHRLVRHANEKKLPVPGNGKSWHGSLVKRLLENRAVFGEFQPHVKDHSGKRVPADGGPIQGFYPAIIDRDTFFAVRELKNKRHTFPTRADSNNHNYLMGIARCGCGGTWRWLNKNGPKQPGYSQYSCSNRERGDSTCKKVNGRLFDFAFVSWALDRIPEMLASGEDPRQARIMSMEAQLDSVKKSRRRLMVLVEDGDEDIVSDILPRLRDLKDKEKALTTELAALRVQAAPVGFTFTEAAEVFLPAYIDYWPPHSQEDEEAFRIRSLFKARVTQAVASVVVSKERTSVTVTLRNEQVDSFELPDPEEVSFGPAPLDEEDLAELDARRRRHMTRAQMVTNVGLRKVA